MEAGKLISEIVDIKRCNNAKQDSVDNSTVSGGDNSTDSSLIDQILNVDKWAVPSKLPACFEIQNQCRKICFKYYDLESTGKNCSGLWFECFTFDYFV
jgi:hypothetical protein